MKQIMINEILSLIDQYWDIAYNEGESGATTDDKHGTAQKTLSKIEMYLDKLIKNSSIDEIKADIDLIDMYQSYCDRKIEDMILKSIGRSM